MTYAVLTGDIIDSSALTASQLIETLVAIEAAHSVIASWTPALTGFAQRSGDAWQMALGQPALALRAALYVQACLRRIDKSRTTRIAVAEGDGTLPEDGDTNTAYGPAFTASGRLLEDLPRNIAMSHASGGAQAATFHLADHISRGWTEAQASALCEALLPDAGPRAQAAAKLGISRPAVNQALWSAGFTALDRALTAWETSTGPAHVRTA